jgi:repressor LexA
MSQVLTPIERRIYNYLVDYLKRETYQPSIREIGSRFGIRSTKTVTEHLQSLQRKGYLDRTPSRSRALRILGLNLSPDTYTIPLYRSAVPQAADEEVEARYDLDRALACSADCFLVRANGENRELGIVEGDLILVEPRSDPQGASVAVFARGGAVELRASGGAGPADGGRVGNTPARFLGVARAMLRVFPRD